MDHSQLPDASKPNVSSTMPVAAANQSVPQATPTRPKHMPSRSVSDLSNIPKAIRHHHHPHLHHREKDYPSPSQSLLLPTAAVEQGQRSKSEGVTPNESRNASRRASVVLAHEETSAIGIPPPAEQRPVKEGEVMEERAKDAIRATELQNALLGLNTLSNNTTRRLDMSYYSVLEKLCSLNATISSLKELAGLTRQLNQEFRNDADELTRDVSGQLNGVKGFEVQEKQIEDLQQRVKAGRERIKVLGSRVDIIKDRVEGWERAEEEWQDRTRRNLRILWIFMSVFMTIILAIVAFQYTPAMTGPDDSSHFNSTGLVGQIPDLQSLMTEKRDLRREVEERIEGPRTYGPWEEDPRLRIFDEL